MTTTDQFQKLPTFYRTEQECKENKYEKANTNPRYSSFTQFCLTAGDVDQFQTYRDPTNGNGTRYDRIDISNNRWKSSSAIENVDWMRYRNLNTESVDSTFRYLFEKFKKGLFIKIKDNKLAVFLPFSKHDYINEWSSFIKHPTEFKSMPDFLIYASNLQGYRIDEGRINRFQNTWYGNNCLIRTEFPVGENDRGLSNMKDMLETLCAERQLPDIELFINKRDFPLIRNTRTEPYEHIYGSENYPLTSHRYETYVPILSMVTTDVNADIPIPTAEDWARVGSQELGKYFSPDCRNYNYDFSMEWERRIPTAVFRGASTGCGVTMETNPRLMVSYLSTISPIENGFRLLDAGITKWNLRPRKHISSEYLKLINTSMMPFKLVQSLTPSQQSQYKYIVHVDGHVSAFRLSLELSSGSVLLIAESKYRLWFRKQLKEYVHYVPVKADLSNLFEQIRWCRAHDAECKQIAANAKRFYDTFLKKDGILDYMQTLFIKLKSVTGSYFYNSISVADIIYEWQLSLLSRRKEMISHLSNLSNLSNLNVNILKNRRYEVQEGLRMALQEVDFSDKSVRNEMYKNRDTSILIQTVNQPQLTFLVKQINQPNRKYELINEAYCGQEINKLSKEIPNFRYTYCIDISDQKTELFLEHIQGVTFKKFIEDGCDMSTFTFLIACLSMALAVAQERCGFVHYDLYPWNIIIMKYQEEQQITYRFGKNVFVVQTKLVPVIIDYGRSHIISKTKNEKNEYVHTGTIEPFKTSVYHDCFSMIISLVNEMMMATSRTFSSDTAKNNNYLVYLVNFYTGTDFKPSPIKNYTELLQFLAIHKKYNEMIYGNKCGLENKTPADLFFYIASGVYANTLISSISQVIYNKTEPAPPIRMQHPLFYYDVWMGEDPSDRIIAYLEEIRGCFSVSSSSSKENKEKEYYELSATYACNMMLQAIDGVKSFCDASSSSFTLEKVSQIREMAEKMEGNVNEWYKSITTFKPLRIQIHYPEQDMLCVAKYDAKTFSMPGRILSILQGNNKEKNEKLLSFREMFIDSTLYHTPHRLSPSFFTSFNRILDVNPLVIINHNANLNTMKYISQIIYQADKEEMTRMRDPPTKTLFLISNILDIVDEEEDD